MHIACDLCHAAKQVGQRCVLINHQLINRNAPVTDLHVPDVQLEVGIVYTLLDNADAPFQKNNEGHP